MKSDNGQIILGCLAALILAPLVVIWEAYVLTLLIDWHLTAVGIPHLNKTQAYVFCLAVWLVVPSTGGASGKSEDDWALPLAKLVNAAFIATVALALAWLLKT